MRGRGLAGVLFGLAGLAGCAQATQPGGGPVPETAPAVVSLTPEPFQVLEPWNGPLRVEFERRISERPSTGSLRDAVIVSPRTGTVEVSHRRRGIEISMEGGFRERTVYQITILPVLQDLFQNRLEAPLEFFFSTGPEFEPNAVAGILTDRLTLQEMEGARVDARRLPDGPTHSAVSDSAGIFAFQYLPSGRYRVVAYDDQNRNREPDFAERQDSIEIELAPGDTLLLTDLLLLAPDTTPARVTGVTPLDSLAVEVTFDDPIDPEESLEGVRALLSREDGMAPTVVEVLHPWVWEEREEARRAREAEEAPADPDPDDPTPPDPDAPPPPDPDVPPPEVEVPEEEAAPPEDDGPNLPGTTLVVVLSSPLTPGASYALEVSGVRNINGVPDGGGEGTFDVPEPEPEEDPPDDDPPPDDPPPDDPSRTPPGRR